MPDVAEPAVVPGPEAEIPDPPVAPDELDDKLPVPEDAPLPPVAPLAPVLLLDPPEPELCAMP